MGTGTGLLALAVSVAAARLAEDTSPWASLVGILVGLLVLVGGVAVAVAAVWLVRQWWRAYVGRS